MLQFLGASHHFFSAQGGLVAEKIRWGRFPEAPPSGPLPESLRLAAVEAGVVND